MKAKFLRLTWLNIVLVYLAVLVVYAAIYAATPLAVTPVMFGGGLGLTLLIATLFWTYYRGLRLKLDDKDGDAARKSSTDRTPSQHATHQTLYTRSPKTHSESTAF